MNRMICMLATGMLLVSCGRSANSKLNERVILELRATSIVLHNNSPEPIYFTIYDSEYFEQIRFRPCKHPAICGRRVIPAGRYTAINYTTVRRWNRGDELTVMSWSLAPNANGSDLYRVENLERRTSITPTRMIFPAH